MVEEVDSKGIIARNRIFSADFIKEKRKKKKEGSKI
jgi:hypothetical protein